MNIQSQIDRTKGRKIFEVCNIIFLSIVLGTMVIPLLNTFAISFSTDMDSMSTTIKLWPEKFSLAGYVTLFQQVRIAQPLINNIIVTVLGTFFHVFLCTVTGYALSKEKLGLQRFFIAFVLITMMVPLQNIMIPLYLLYKKLHLVNSLWAIIVTNMITGYTVMLLKNFFESIPKSLGEAAYIDGATELDQLFKVYLPLAKPGLATVTLFQFVERWNHFMESVIFISDPRKYTLQVALKALVVDSDASSSATFITKNAQMAGVIIAIIPLLAIYPFLQKYFISGLMLGSTKG